MYNNFKDKLSNIDKLLGDNYMKLKIEYNSQIIEFIVEYRKRKTFEISIDPPDIVKVAAPIGAKEDIIVKIVESKAKWIIKKLSFFREIGYVRERREYAAGEVFMYLGKNYSLHIVIDESVSKPTIKLYHDMLYLTTNTNDKEIIKATIKEWYIQKTYENVFQKVEHYQPYFTVQPKYIKVKEQKKRWGSCGTNRHILFNWRCSMAPSYVIDYIVVHEMSHLVHMNHSQDFWKLVESIIPNYRKAKEWLKRNGFRMFL